MDKMTNRLISILVLITIVLSVSVALMLNDPRIAIAADPDPTVSTGPPSTLPTQATITKPPGQITPRPRVTVTKKVRIIKIIKKTVTAPPVIRVVPGPTKTVRGPTVTAPALPRATVTATTTVTVTRQPEPKDDTVEPTHGGFHIGDGVLTRTEKILSLTAMVLAGMVTGILMLWMGFVMGYKNADRKNQKFWLAMREQLFGNK